MTTRPAREPSARGGCPSWSRPAEAVRLFLSGVTVRAAAPVALVVGTLLSAVNEGGVLLAGHVRTVVVVRVVVNYLTPFVVASLGFLAAGREPAPHG